MLQDAAELARIRGSLRDLVAELPLGRLLLETDCPYLAPQAHRGKRNEPAYLTWVGAEIADLKELDIRDVAGATTENARRLFGLRSYGS